MMRKHTKDGGDGVRKEQMSAVGLSHDVYSIHAESAGGLRTHG